MSGNLLYAQSGGMTAVINTSACGVIEAARTQASPYSGVFAARNGLLGVLEESLYDLMTWTDEQIASLRYRPGGVFGSCRLDLDPFETHQYQYTRVFEVFAAHDIRGFIYNGGGGSMLTAWRMAQAASACGYPLSVIGVPKTIDNDLYATDTSPGFGSAAKYLAVSIREAAMDVAAMCATSTQVFLLEVMGRHSGWLAAAAGLAEQNPGELPLLLLFAEIPFDVEHFLAAVRDRIRQVGYCVIVVSEGLRERNSSLLKEHSTAGVTPALADLLTRTLDLHVHWAVADYLQRSARHLASRIDVEQAYAVGRTAVELAAQGRTGVMVTLQRLTDHPYCWRTGSVSLMEVADRERLLPLEFIDVENFRLTDAARKYLQPLIQGEDHPPFISGLPAAEALPLRLRRRRLSAWDGWQDLSWFHRT